jgi:hypothetical protein
MVENTCQALPTLTVLAIGLAFGFMIGMLWYYPEIAKLRAKIKSYFK